MLKIIRVDEEQACEVEEDIRWVYTSRAGFIEGVKYSTKCTSVEIVEGNEAVQIHTEDIPNLIKALQAAHKHITNS